VDHGERTDITKALARWKLDLPAVRSESWSIARPRERERGRWQALWLLARGWTAADVAAALERDSHTVGEWLARFCRDGPTSLTFAQTGGSPPALDAAQQAQLKAAVQDDI
jgi:transposase